MIESFFQTLFSESLDFFTNPQKRVYWLYLLSAIFIGLSYLSYKYSSFFKAYKQLFSKEAWCSNSAKADYKLLLINNIFLFLLSPKLIGKNAIALGIFYFLSDFNYSSASLQGVLSNLQVAILFTSVLFIFEDFTKYWLHRWLHTVAFLWPYHRVHHSATSLNFFTVFRTHPIEAILFSLRAALVQGFIIGVFFFLFADQINLFMVLGANVFSFLFNLLGSNLRHSPIALPYPKFLEKIFLSPAQHHIHHSKAREHKDKNFGIVLACWDRCFGSFHHSIEEELEYGLSKNAQEKEHKLSFLYLNAFSKSFNKTIFSKLLSKK